MNKAYILLGSNKGDRVQMLAQSNEMIEKMCGKIIKYSSVYETTPWGEMDAGQFLNQVILIHTSLSSHVLLNKLQVIELILGRVRYNDFYESRPIDLDILFYNDSFISESNLHIPHPLLHERMFTLVPLAEIAGDLIHPVLQKSINEIMKDCIDKTDIIKFSIGNSVQYTGNDEI